MGHARAQAFSPVMKEKISVFCSETLGKLAESNDAQDFEELLAKWRDFHAAYLAATMAILQQWAEKYGPANKDMVDVIDKIEADSVVIEVLDQQTGKLFRRNLPLKYLETDNGLFLSGETIEGSPSQIAFYSETARNRIHDLLGKGPDTERCKD
jgi:hypothetical protein